MFCVFCLAVAGLVSGRLLKKQPFAEPKHFDVTAISTNGL